MVFFFLAFFFSAPAAFDAVGTGMSASTFDISSFSLSNICSFEAAAAAQRREKEEEEEGQRSIINKQVFVCVVGTRTEAS